MYTEKRFTEMRISLLFLLLTGLLRAGDGDGLDRARNLYNRTDYRGAVAILSHQPANAQTLELLGQSYLALGEFKKATETLEKAAVLDPSDSMLRTWLGRAWGRRAENAFALTAMSQAAKSREEFEKAVQLDPSNAEGMNDLFDFYLEAPALVGGGQDKARKLLPALARCDPDAVYFAEARLAEQQKQFDLAEAHLRQAVLAVPGKVGQVLNLARFLARRARYEESDRVFQKAREMAPNSPRVLFARAETLFRTHRHPDEARALLKQYLAAKNLTPDDPPRSEALELLKKVEGT
jgi:tetratricopeptide (TPR) repeat protein